VDFDIASKVSNKMDKWIDGSV